MIFVDSELAQNFADSFFEFKGDNFEGSTRIIY